MQSMLDLHRAVVERLLMVEQRLTALVTLGRSGDCCLTAAHLSDRALVFPSSTQFVRIGFHVGICRTGALVVGRIARRLLGRSFGKQGRKLQSTGDQGAVGLFVRQIETCQICCRGR